MPAASTSEYILAIDLGTSGPKAGLVAPCGTVTAHAFAPTRFFLFPDGGAEQDPAEWWSAIEDAVGRLLHAHADKAGKIAGIACTSQWSGTVAVDAAGRPLMNAVIWMDSRGARYARRITSGFPEVKGYNLPRLLYWLRLTGGIPTHSGKDAIAHILYIRHEHPQVYAEAYKFLEPKDYLNLCLTGEFAATYDSIALHWVTDNRDVARVRYDPRLLQMTGIAREKLPDLQPAATVVGKLRPVIAARWGLSPGIPVVAGTPDIQSAALGSGAVRDFEGHLYIGTSSWLTCHIPSKKTDILHNMTALPAAVPGRYFVANEQETAGACLNFLCDNILFPNDQLGKPEKPADVYPLLSAVAGSIPAGSGRVIFTPWLYGERTPVDDRTVRGAFYNLSLNTRRGHLVRAVMEGVAFNSRWLLTYVEKFIQRNFPALNMIGGGACSDVWCQIHADVLNRPIRQVKAPIVANLRGAAMLGFAALGFFDFQDIGNRVQVARVFTPIPGHRDLYDVLFREYKRIYKANRKIYARLNRGR